MKIPRCCLILLWLTTSAYAAPTSSPTALGDEEAATASTPTSSPTFSLDEVQPPPEPRVDLPPMPKDVEDFSKDLGDFKEVTTAPEDFFKTQRAAADKSAKDEAPYYRRNPPVAWAGEAGAGFFAASALGLLGGALGDAIDPGDPQQSLGGVHGPVFGGALGTLTGTTLGVWGASRLVDHETHPGWIVGGAVAGSLLGSAMAFGIAEGSTRGSGGDLAVGTFLIAQLGAAVLFTELFEEKPKEGKEKGSAEAR